MSTSISEINDRVYLELEVAAEFLSVDKIHNAVVQRHAVRTAQAGSSAVNVLLGVTPSFTPTTVDHDISALIGKGIPAWLQYLVDDDWKPMRIINLNQVADYAMLGVLAAAFHSETSATSSVEPVQYVTFTELPGTPCRIRFDRDIVRLGIADNILLPDNVSELIVKEAENMLIPRIKASIDVRCRNDKELRIIARDLKQSLSEIQEQNKLEIKDLMALWRQWAFTDRAAGGTSFNKPTPSSRGQYGINY